MPIFYGQGVGKMVKKPVVSSKKITVKPKTKTVTSKVVEKVVEPKKVIKPVEVEEVIKKPVVETVKSAKVLTAEGWKRRKSAEVEIKKGKTRVKK
jgi:hypothetical protein